MQMTHAMTFNSGFFLLAAGLVVGGAAAGFLAGLFGVGGGAILVPVLYELFGKLGIPDDVKMPLSVGTSLAIIVPTAIRSYRAHLLHGHVDKSVLRQWSVPVVIGVVAGCCVARYAQEYVFKIVFILVGGVCAIRLLFGNDTWRIAADFPSDAVMRVFGLGIGLLSALMGIGGGQLSNLLMTLYGRPIHQSISTSSGLGVLIAIPAALGYIYAGWPVAARYPEIAALQPPLTLGYISVVAVCLVVPTSLLMAPAGARMAHRLPKRKLEVLFGIFLVCVCARFAVSLR